MVDKKYELNIEEVKNKAKESHKPGTNYKLLPYTTNDGKVVIDFKGVTGAFSRNLSDRKKDKKKEFSIDLLMEQVKKVVTISNEKEFYDLKKIIENIFIIDNNLINFHAKTLNYIDSKSEDEKIANFIYNSLFDEELKNKALKIYNEDSKNIMYKLMLEALENLNLLSIKANITEEYKNNLPIVKKIFNEDISFLLNNKELFNLNIERFLEYYYFLYVSQLSIKLNKFEKADLNTLEKVYFTINTEKTVSKSRKTYDYGVKRLKEEMIKLFSHANTLELLNTTNGEEKFNYIELFEVINNDENQDLIGTQIEEIILTYREKRNDVVWENIKELNLDSGNSNYNNIYKLFKSIDYQFNVSSRNRAYTGYSNWIIKFMENKFGKRRGSLGYVLSLSEDDVILFTQLIMKNSEKIRRKDLFRGFEERGISFDRESENKIIGLYEKLNLIEKKSDSGDAMYVKTIL